MKRKLKAFDVQSMLEQKQLVVVAQPSDDHIVELFDVKAIMISPDKGMAVAVEDDKGEVNIAPLDINGDINFFDHMDKNDDPFIKIMSELFPSNVFKVMVVEESESENEIKDVKVKSKSQNNNVKVEKLNSFIRKISVDEENMIGFEIKKDDLEKKAKETGKSKSQIISDFISQQIENMINED